MSLNKKFRACSITFLLIISSLSIFILPGNVVAGEDDTKIDLMEIFNPFKTNVLYFYDGDETLEIQGDVSFNLYFYSPLLSQHGYKDDVKVAIYEFTASGMFLNEIKNGHASITLDSASIEEPIQKYTIKLEDVDITIEPGDELLFVIEILPTGKCKFF